MKSICITGDSSAALAQAAGLLLQAGMQAPNPAGRTEPIDMAHWHQQVTAAAFDDAQAPYAIVEPGRLWEQLAGELVMANAKTKVWGWSDTLSVWLLDFWAEFEKRQYFVLVCTTLEHTLAQAMTAGTAPGAVQGLVDSWQSHHQHMLQFYHRHSQRCVLVDADDLAAYPLAFVQRCAKQWKMPLDGQALSADALPGGPLARDPLAHYLARDICQGYPQVSSLQGELGATMLPLGEHSIGQAPETDTVIAQYQQLAQVAAQLSQDKANLAAELSKLIANNDQLTRASAQLASEKDAEAKAKQDAAAQRDALAAEKSQLIAARDALAKEKADLAAARDAEAKAKQDATAQRDALAAEKAALAQTGNEQTQENELLLLQLHQVQEELEQYFLQGQDTQKQLEQTRQAGDALAAEKTQLIAARDALAAEKSILIANNDQLTRASAQLAAEKDAEAKAKQDASAQRDALAAEKSQLVAARDALAKEKTALAQAGNEQAQENELLLLQLHQVQEELEHYFLQHQEAQQQKATLEQRWRLMLDRTPGYCHYDSLELLPPLADAAPGTQRWRLNGLVTPTHSLASLELHTVVEDQLAGFMLSRGADGGTSPLLRWPAHAAAQAQLSLMPGGTRDTISQRLETLLSLSTSDWALLRTLAQLFVTALQNPAAYRAPADFVPAPLQAGLAKLLQVMDALPPTVRYDQISLKRAQVSPDYEHLWVCCSKLSFGKQHYPEFEFRLSCANVRPDRFGSHPKLEFPQDVSQAPLPGWFVESYDDFGAKLELRFAQPDAMDMAVWQQLPADDKKFVQALVQRISAMLLSLQDAAPPLKRAWADWQQLAQDMQRILTLRAAPPPVALPKAAPAPEPLPRGPFKVAPRLAVVTPPAPAAPVKDTKGAKVAATTTAATAAKPRKSR
jgi:hypothetical protein